MVSGELSEVVRHVASCFCFLYVSHLLHISAHRSALHYSWADYLIWRWGCATGTSHLSWLHWATVEMTWDVCQCTTQMWQVARLNPTNNLEWINYNWCYTLKEQLKSFLCILLGIKILYNSLIINISAFISLHFQQFLTILYIGGCLG